MSFALIVMMLLASIPSLAFADVTPQAPDKKVKFLVKHADNERLRAMFYPEEITVSDGTVILPDQPVESVEQPPIEVPATEEPVEEEQAAPVDESAVEEPAEEESAAPVEEPVVEEPVEEPVEEESTAPVVEPVAEEPAEEEPVAPVVELTVEEPAEEEPAAPVEEPTVEEPAEEEPAAPVEEPAVEEPAEEELAAPVEESAVEEPADEEPAAPVEESTAEEPVQEEPATPAEEPTPVVSELICEEVTNDLMLVEATYEEIQALLEDPDVYAVEVDAEVHITEEIMPGNLVAIGMDQIQDESFQGQGIKVAILDTGIDLENTDLNLAGGISFVEGDSFDDTNGHGTALAGIINAQINDEGLIGMAPQAELYAVKVLDSTGTGYYSDVIQGLAWCQENRMDIVVMSFGADQYSGILHESVQGMYYQDGLMIAAAGNTSQVQYPAAYPEVMAVGGVDETGLPTYVYVNADLVDLYALGTGIESYDMNQGQALYAGTSFSAAEAAGAAAALWSYDPVKTNDMVRASLVSSCTPEDLAASPILEMLPIYNDAVNGVVVDPGDNTGEVDPDENPDAEVNASEVVSGQDVFGNDQPIHFSVKFSHDHDIVEAATKDGGTVLDTDSVSNVVGGFEGGAYTGQSYDFDFAPIPYKGNYIADFKPKSLNEETGGWQIEYPFDEPFTVIQPDLVPTITHVNLGEVVVDEATDSLHQDPLVKVTVQVKNVDEYRYQGDVTVKAYLEKQNENLQTIRILLDSVSQNRTIQSGEIVDYVLAWDPIANNDGEYVIEAEVLTSNGNYEPSDNNTAYYGDMVSLSTRIMGGKAETLVYLADPVAAATGNYTVEVEDIAIAGKAPIQLMRYYHGRDYTESSLGKQWRHSYDSYATQVAEYTKVYFGDGHAEFFYANEAGELSFDTSVYKNVYYNSVNQLILETKAGKTYTYENGLLTTIEDTTSVWNLTYANGKLAKVESQSGWVEFFYDGEKLDHVTDSAGRTVDYQYTNGFLTGITNVDGHTWGYAYNAAGLIEKTIDPNGTIEIVNEYDESSHIVQQINEDGTSTSFVYSAEATVFTDKDGTVSTYYKDELGRVNYKVYPHGEEKYVFDDSDNLIETTDKNGNITNYFYNADGNLEREVNALGEETTYTYTPEGKVATVTDPEGGTTHYGYNAFGQVNSVVDELGRVITLNFDGDGNVSATILPDGTVTNMMYDAIGNVTAITDADGNTQSFGYDAANRVVSTSNARGMVTETSYLPSGRVDTISYPDGTQIRKNYNNRGELIRTVDEENRITSYTYTVMGDLNTVTAPDGTVTGYDYDSMQNLTAITFTDGSQIHYTYDNAGRMLTMTDQEGNLTTYVYDNFGNLISETDPLGSTTVYEYDALNRLVAVVDANGNRTETTYRFDGQVTSVTDALLNTSRRVYDAAGQLIKEVDALGGEAIYTFDLLGRVKTKTDELGNTERYSYNALGKVTQVIYPGQSQENFAYEGNGNLVLATDALGNQTSYSYDERDRLVSITDAAGFTTTMTYTAAGQLASVTDAEGYQTSFVYDGLDRVIKEKDKNGDETKYVYDGLGNLKEIHRFNGTEYSGLDELVTYYSYNLKGEKVQETAPNGSVTLFTYDGAGNLISKSDALGAATTFAYDAVNNLMQKTLANGGMETYAYDALNRLVSVTDAENFTESYAYDANSNQISVTDRNGSTTQYQYDAAGQLVREIDALNNQTSHTYDVLGRLVRTTDALNNVYEKTYDAVGNNTAIILPTGAPTSFTYDPVGNKASVTDGEGYTTTYAYDGMGRVISSQTPDGLQETFEYDSMGNLTATTDRLGQRTEYEYDFMDRLVKTTDPALHTETASYTELGRVANTTDKNGNETVYEYDVLGQVTAKVDALNQRTEYVYDSMGNLTTLRAFRGISAETIARTSQPVSQPTETVETVYAYNLRGELVQETTPTGLSISYAYDGNGNLTGKTDEQGFMTQYSYDSANNQTAILYNDGRQVTRQYNVLNQETAMTDWLGTKTYVRDALGRILSSTDFEGKTTAFTWNSRDQKMTISYPDGSQVAYNYDVRGNLASVTDGFNAVTSYTYDVLDRVLSETMPNGNVTTFTYDAVSNVLEETATTQDGTLVLKDTFTYDANGNKTSRVETALKNITVYKTETYTYDAVNQLIESVNQDQVSEKYFYDSLGNRIRKEVFDPNENKPEIKVTAYTYNNEHQLLALQGPDEEVGGHITSDPVTFTYDARGNLTRIQTLDGTIGQYYFDAMGKMTYSVNKMGITSAYTYDGTGARVKQAVDAKNINVPETSKLYDQELLETLLADDDGLILKTKKEINYVIDPTSVFNDVLMTYGMQTKTQRYTYGFGVIALDTWHETEANWADVSQDNLEMRLFYVKDALGSTRALVKGDGNLGAYYDYDAFGTPTEKNHIKDQGIRSNVYQYAGYVYDYAISLYFVNARYYMPEAGRFTGKDRFKGDGLNLYVYVKSNPMRFVDPSGFCAAEGQLQDDYGNNYLLISIKQVVMGNYTEDVTALGTAGQIGIAIIGLDAPMDARDLVYDLTNWEWSWGHAGQTLIDIIAFVPVIGALKYADESAILIKQADLAKYVKNSEKTGDVLDSIGELFKTVDDTTKYSTDVYKGASKHIPIKRYTEISEVASHNAFSSNVMLGKYDGNLPTNYINQAKDKGFAYFDLGEEWGAIKLEFDLTDDDMFDLFNAPYLDDAMANNKVFHFSHNPVGDTGALGNELNYLEANGYVYDVATMTASPIN